jgi:nitrite reductase (NADH) small subunit
VSVATTTVGLVAVGRAEDIPRLEARSLTVGGRRIAIHRTERGFRATDAECPHAGGPLADGLIGDGCVTCPLHGWRFDLETGRAIGEDAAVAVHEVVERDGWLYLRLPE